MNILTKTMIALLLLVGAACSRSEPRSSDKMNEPKPTLEEQQSATRDPLHRPYEKLFRATGNLSSCERDRDPRVVSVVRERKRAEEMARAKGFGPAMALTERIVLFHMQAELHGKCLPNFATALREMDHTVVDFRELIEKLPPRNG